MLNRSPCIQNFQTGLNGKSCLFTIIENDEKPLTSFIMSQWIEGQKGKLKLGEKEQLLMSCGSLLGCSTTEMPIFIS